MSFRSSSKGRLSHFVASKQDLWLVLESPQSGGCAHARRLQLRSPLLTAAVLVAPWPRLPAVTSGCDLSHWHRTVLGRGEERQGGCMERCGEERCCATEGGGEPP